MNGRLLPFGWWHFLNRKRITDRVRIGFLGVLPEFQHTGVAAALYIEHFDMAEGTRRQGGVAGLDPGDEQGDEPRAGGDGRPDRHRATGSTSGCSILRLGRNRA